MRKVYSWIGFSAPLVYIITVILGGFLWQGYSHTRQPISELTMAGAPNLALMDGLFLFYNLLLLIFSLAFWQMARKNSSTPLTISAIFLTICALTGVGFSFFRQDPTNAPLTISGTIHLVLAGIASLSTILAIFSSAAGFGRLTAYRRLKPFSLVMGSLVLVTGGLTAAGASLFPNFFGILERLTIGSFMLWLLVISWHLLRRT